MQIEQDRPDGPRRRSAASKFMDSITRAVSAIGSLMIVGLMVGINLDVGGRYFFNSPLPGTAEIISASIVSIIFLQLADCIRTDRMIRSDILLARLVVSRPRLADWFYAVFALVGFGMLAVLVWFLIPSVSKAFYQGHTVGVPGMFVMPVWPFYALVLTGAVLATLEYLRAAFAHFSAALKGERT